MKKILSAVLVFSLLAVLTTASSSEAGTLADPLITRSYADGTYTDSLIKACTEIINSRVDQMRESLGGAVRPDPGVKVVYSDGWDRLASQIGHSVTLLTGSSFLLTLGTTTVKITSGEVIDVATGKPVASGTSLRPLTRYFCTENTVAVFTSVDGSAFLVEGGYSPDAGISRQYQDYTDVIGLEWYTDPARYVKTTGLFHDYNADTFRPQNIITRAELVYALWVACGKPSSNYVPTFQDLKEDWYIPAVKWAAEHGITAGLDSATFSPMGGVNREQLAAMLFRCARFMGDDVTSRADLTRYSDWKLINDWAVEPISWATAVGYISGMDIGTVAPWEAATRAQTASVIMRYATLNR